MKNRMDEHCVRFEEEWRRTKSEEDWGRKSAEEDWY